MAIITLHVLIHGRVQGVGYRAWTVGQARKHGLNGWVRNRKDGTVEAVFSGSQEDVEAMLEACREGPPAARVTDIRTRESTEPSSPGFIHRDTE